MVELNINDPVHVKQSSGHTLEGVVAFVGKVKFADGDDWVGVLLTGSSAGQGKNDGTVKGEKYFNCAQANSGLFTRKANITKRTLSKLEELRLRRELAASGIGGGPGGTGSSSTTSSRSVSINAPVTPKAGSDLPKETPKSKSRLEELRMRRAALQTDKAAMTPKQQKEQFEGKLHDKDTKITSLERELENLKQKYQQEEDKIQQMKQELSEKDDEIAKLKTDVATAAAAGPGEASASSDAAEAAESDAQKAQKLEEELQAAQSQVQSLTQDIVELKANQEQQMAKSDKEIVSLTAEVRALQDSSSATQQRDASQYKELAKIQAEYSALKRKYEQLGDEKVSLESNVEDLTLDKDQLQEEKDALEERLEEIKIDAETAQMECEELRMELESARNAAADASSAANGGAGAVGGATTSTEEDDKAQALAFQNARLREALIRLREQTSVEKIEMSRHLKAADKAQEESKKISEQLESYKSSQSTMEEQLEDLKDMVEQGAAFEGMVEDLSDRLLSLEEDNGALRTTVRELEEAAELTAEMEEVQADELKALFRDLEGRDSVIRNLEEAIKMQRRREEDFSRTVGNYRNMVETLKKEKEALLELQQGGEGEKSNLIASSQKALARAAQLVSDAAEMRKREAQAVMDKIEGQVSKHLAERLERLVPRSVAGTEISAMKGELTVCKVASMASQSLQGIGSSFSKTMRLIPAESAGTDSEEESKQQQEVQQDIQLTDETIQEVVTMSHQSECAHVLINISADLLRLVVAGQWPELLSENGSTELGALLSHSVSELEGNLRVLLTSLKQEGVISPHQSNVENLRQSSIEVIKNLTTDLNEANIPVPKDWNAPGLELFCNASHAKYSCLGVGAIVAAAAKDNENLKDGQFRSLLVKLGNLSTEATNACNMLANLGDASNDNGDAALKLSDSVLAWKNVSVELLNVIRGTFCSNEVGAAKVSRDGLVACEQTADKAVSTASQFFSALRRANDTAAGVPVPSSLHRTLSPEADDVWDVVSTLARAVRKRDGDEEDVNFLFRARAIENRLTNAIDKEPKLSLANAKVASLEKSLASRSKEIAMQNARLSELEKLLAKTSSRPSPGKKSATLKSSEEFNSMKEENRVLMEAMDVLQRQVDEYENEIRMLKDMKTPKKGSHRTPRRSMVADYASDRRSIGGARDADDTQTVVSSSAVGALEATLFRPALNSALRDAAKWKGRAVSSSLLDLPPLTLPSIAIVGSREESKEELKTDDLADNMFELRSALSDFRMQQASIAVVDLSKKDNSPRAVLRKSKAQSAAAAARLQSAAANLKRSMSNSYGQIPPSIDITKTQLLGKVKVAGQEPFRNVSTVVSKDDLLRLQLHLIK